MTHLSHDATKYVFWVFFFSHVLEKLIFLCTHRYYWQTTVWYLFMEKRKKKQNILVLYSASKEKFYQQTFLCYLIPCKVKKKHLPHQASSAFQNTHFLLIRQIIIGNIPTYKALVRFRAASVARTMSDSHMLVGCSSRNLKNCHSID